MCIRDSIKGVCRRLAIQDVERREGEGREWLVESEAGLQVRRHPHGPAGLVRRLETLHDAGAQQGPVDLDGPARQPGLVARLLVVVTQELTHRLERRSVRV